MFSCSIRSARRIKETPRRRITVMSSSNEISDGTCREKGCWNWIEREEVIRTSAP
jgi:hypothetical protein